jgi:hypothetical protein
MERTIRSIEAKGLSALTLGAGCPILAADAVSSAEPLVGVMRAKTFADRLPAVVPREEADISHLSDEMADILYPGRRPRPFRIALEFDRFDDPSYAQALTLARGAAVYEESEKGDRLVHRAGFDTRGASALRDLFQLVGHRPGTEVLVDGKRVPYARELWLPLLWMFVGEGSER